MGAVLLLARSRLRVNRHGTLALVLMVGLAVAVVLAAVAGARRTDRALADFVAADRGADAYAAFIPAALGGGASRDLAPEAARIAAIDGVQAVHRFANAQVSATDPRAPGGQRRVMAWIAMEPGGLTALGRPHVVESRMPHDGAGDEVAVDEELARDAALRLGDRYPLRLYAADQAGISLDAVVAPRGGAVDATVVGIVRRPTDLRDLEAPANADSGYLVHHDLYLTAALWDEARGDVAVQNPFVGITLTPGGDLDTVLRAAVKGPDGAPFVISQRDFLDLLGTFKGVERSISLQSRALQVFAVVAALAGLFLVGQTVGRQLYLEAADTPPLRSMGLTRRQLRTVSLLRAAPAAVGGTAVGILGAIALSALAPLPGTIARRSELALGVHVDGAALGLGAIVAPLVLVLAALAPLRAGASRAGEHPQRRPTLAARLSTAGGSAPAVIGVRFALEAGRGRTAVPVRTATATAAAAVAVVVAAVVFIASVDGAHDHPDRYGVTWDLSAGAMFSLDEADERASQVAAVPGVADGRGHGWVAIPAALLPPAGLIPQEDRAWYIARLRDQPAATFTEPVRLTGASAHLPRAFIRCTGGQLDVGGDPIEAMAGRARATGWIYRELSAPHDPHLFDPAGTAAILHELASTGSADERQSTSRSP